MISKLYRIELNNEFLTNVNGIYTVNLQAAFPEIIGRSCKVSWSNVIVEATDRSSLVPNLVTNAAGNATTALVVKTDSALALGPVGTKGFLKITGNATVGFTTLSATTITLDSAQSWAAADIAVEIQSVTGAGNTDLTRKPFSAFRTNIKDLCGTKGENRANTELLSLAMGSSYSFTHGASDSLNEQYMVMSNESQAYYKGVVPSQVELRLTTDSKGDEIVTNLTNSFRIQLTLEL